MRITPLLTIGVLALAGCSVEGLIDNAYPDRARFEFVNTDQDTVLFYACENGPTAAETEKRAKQAHRFVDANIKAAAEMAATRMIEGIDAGQSAIGVAFETNRQLDAQMEVLVEETEARFQCIMYNTQDL